MKKNIFYSIFVASFVLMMQCTCEVDVGVVIESGSIVQLSKVNKNEEVRMLKASLIPCLNHSHINGVKCKPRVEIKAWLDPRDEHETFLLIDEVYDAKERMNFPLLHPYIIQVSMSEQTLLYPLLLNQVVDVSCTEHEVVQRREADNDGALVTEGDRMNPEDLSNAIRTEDNGAIKKDFTGLVPENGTDGKRTANGNDLLLFSHNARMTTKYPSAGFEVQHQNDMAGSSKTNKAPGRFGSFTSEIKKIEVKFNQNAGDQRKLESLTNMKSEQKHPAVSSSNAKESVGVHNSHRNEFQFDGSPQFGYISDSTTNPYRFSDMAINYHTNHRHQLTPNHRVPNRHQNRFHVNQIGNEAVGERLNGEKLIENEMPAGVINDPYSPELNVFNEKKEMKKHRDGNMLMSDRSYANSNFQFIPNDDDVSATFREFPKQSQMHDETSPPLYQLDNRELETNVAGQIKSNANFKHPLKHQLRKFKQPNEKLLKYFHKTSNIANPQTDGVMNQLNDVHQMASGDGTEFYQTSIDDSSKKENDNSNGSNIAGLEPIDKEDDPNLLVERESFEPTHRNVKSSNRITLNQQRNQLRVKRFFRSDDAAALMQTRLTKENVSRVENHLNTRRTVKARRSETFFGEGSRQKLIKNIRYAVYTMTSTAFHHTPTRIQVFRKQNEKWFRIQPETTITSKSENFTSGDFHVQSSSRRSTAGLFDMKQTMLLVPNNETLIGSLLTHGIETMLVSADEITQSICSSAVDEKSPRTVTRLQDSGMLPKYGNAITQCPLNVDQVCLNVKDNDPPTWKLEIDFPMLHNEILDARSSSVKISNIFIDTLDGVNLFAQFEITSMDHFTKSFHLTFSGCELLRHLNVSHPAILPPNKSMMVNLTIPLPFYAKHKEEKCEVNIVNEVKKVVARREFILDPKGARCLCLWYCDCFCFGSFLTAVAYKMCHMMNPKNEFYAGFYDENQLEEIQDEIELSSEQKKQILIMLPIFVLLFALLLGSIKACLGCCFTRVGIWKFNYVHPFRTYRESSRCRRFIVNVLFFFLLPLGWCCCCCCSKQREYGSDASLSGRKVVQKEIYPDEESDENDFNDEDTRLLKPTATSSEFSSIFEKHRRSSETVFDVRSVKNPFDDDELENDTTFVVNAMSESHESLRKLESHHSEVNTTSNPRFLEAEQFVKELSAARVVYCRFTEPIGFVKVNYNQPYSIRGYFIPAQGSSYQFMTYNPIKQIYEVSSNFKLVSIAPQILLDSKAFRRSYANKMEVLEANDLSIYPTAPCVNVLVQSSSMYR